MREHIISIISNYIDDNYKLNNGSPFMLEETEGDPKLKRIIIKNIPKNVTFKSDKSKFFLLLKNQFKYSDFIIMVENHEKYSINIIHIEMKSAKTAYVKNKFANSYITSEYLLNILINKQKISHNIKMNHYFWLFRKGRGGITKKDLKAEKTKFYTNNREFEYFVFTSKTPEYTTFYNKLIKK